MPVDTRQHLARRIARFIVRAAPKAVRLASTADQKAMIDLATEGVLRLWAMMAGEDFVPEPAAEAEDHTTEPKAAKVRGKASTKRGET